MIPEDPAVAAIAVGDLTAPATENYVSLRDADVNADISVGVRADRIVDAVQRIEAALGIAGNIPDAIRERAPE